MNPQQAWIIHGFRGKPQQMEQLSAHDFFFSFGLHFNEETLRQTPLDRIFLETDDEEVSISSIYNKVSSTLDINKEMLAIEIEKRFVELF